MVNRTRAKDTPHLEEMQRTEIETPYMIQRLKIPKGEGGNPFEFGCGLKRGGLSEEAYAMLNKIFNFDYMGNGEFEHGGVQRAFHDIQEFAFEKKLVKNALEVGEGSIFYICHKGVESDVRKSLKRLLKEDEMARTVEWVGLGSAIKSAERKPGDIAGWIDIKNNFMFFVDRTMFEKMAGVFGV